MGDNFVVVGVNSCTAALWQIERHLRSATLRQDCSDCVYYRFAVVRNG